MTDVTLASARDEVASRVLMLSATQRDGIMTAAVLERAGIRAHSCANLDDAVQEMGRGAGALLVAEETLLSPDVKRLTQALATQPPWSDLPVLLLARPGPPSPFVDQAMQTLANVTVIERPVRIASLVSAVRAALRARARQLDLRDLLHSLHQADRRKTEFLATLAHELRNPLAPLTTTLALLERTQPAPTAASPHYALMARQLDHMGRLVNDLMEVSRVTRGKIALQPEVLALEAVIRDAVELSRPAIEARQQHLVMTDIEPGLAVRGDRVRLAQVFSNLLNNAAKYTPPGGHIEIAARRHAGMACLTVRDDGSGIPASMLESIFEMFVQVNDTGRAAQGGLGIGLTLVRNLVELHGGSVRARSEGLGLGSEFEVVLPLVTPAEALPAPTQEVAQPLLGIGRIMVVDDNRDAADTLAALLAMLGAETAVAYDGAQALALASAFRPAVGILDIGMPGMDGHDLAARLRADTGHARLMLIAMTGWNAADDEQRTGAPPPQLFDHHLLKPPDIKRLTALLASLVPPGLPNSNDPAGAA